MAGVLHEGQEIPALQGGFGFTKLDELFNEVQQGVGVRLLLGDVAVRVIGMHRQPGLSLGKAGMGLVVPLHGRPAAIAAFVQRPEGFSHRVFDVRFASDGDIPQADFFTVIQERCAFEGEQHGRCDFGAPVILTESVPGGCPLHIVVA